jgi:DNA-directed RNA polymerase specialized sigma24 family protein
LAKYGYPAGGAPTFRQTLLALFWHTLRPGDHLGTDDRLDGPRNGRRPPRRAQAGDADAFGVLFERHASAVLRFCFRRTGNATLAEDLTSIVFLEAWRVRGKTVFFESRALPWLLGVALNVLRSQARAERGYREALARLPSDHLPSPKARPPSPAWMRNVRCETF